MHNWYKLHELANSIYALKPWRFMLEDEIMGVVDPVTGTTGFISVMGNLGEHFAITVYLGERAFGQFLELSDAGPSAVPEMVIEIPQLMLSFEQKDYLQKEDLAILKTYGSRFTGNKVRPMFRSYKPGMVPWFFTENEQESMVHYLKQFLEVIVSTGSEKKFHQPGSKKIDKYLVRESTGAEDKIKWHSTYKEIFFPEKQEIVYVVNQALIDKVQSMPAGDMIIETDFFLMPNPVKEKNRRPFFPYMLLVVDHQSELIISAEMNNPSQGIENMLAQVPEAFLTILSKGKSLPKTVYTTSHRVIDLLSPVMSKLEIHIQYNLKLKGIDKGKRGIDASFGRDL